MCPVCYGQGHCPLGLAGHMHSPKDVRRHLKSSPSCSHYTKVGFQLDLFQVSRVKHSSCCMDWPDSLDTQKKDLHLMTSICFYKEPHQPQTVSCCLLPSATRKKTWGPSHHMEEEAVWFRRGCGAANTPLQSFSLAMDCLSWRRHFLD